MNSVADLTVKCRNIKRRFLLMYKKANAGHVGSSLSVAEILTFVRFAWMSDHDYVLLSKGHAAASLYAMLAEDGTISEAEINTFYENGTYLAAHPPVNKIRRIPFATGSLGHGLSLAAGLAFAQKLKKANKKIFCITSDGELNEGSTWEAAMFIVQHQLTNIIWLIDRNKLQGYGHTEDVMRLEPLADKLKAFGFNVCSVDGHDFAALDRARINTEKAGIPGAIICDTTKGRHWLEQAGKVDCHYVPMKENDYDAILANIDDTASKTSNA